MSRTKKLWIGVGCVIGVIFLIGIISAAVGGGSDQPTAAPAPTETPVVEGCSPAERAYANKIGASAVEMSGYLDNINALSSQATLAPDLMVDAQWRREVTTTLGGMERAANEMSVTTGPASTSAIREDLTFMAAATAEFAYLYSEGINQMDGALITASADALRDIKHYANAAARKMGQVCG